MTLEWWFAYLLTSIILSLSPGSGAINTMTTSLNHGYRSFFILFRDKKRPLLKLQGPGTSKHHIGRHDATVKIIWPDGVQ